MSDDILFPSLVRDVKTLRGSPVLEARQITPAEFRTGISDRAAAALDEIANLRREFDKVDYVDGDTGPIAWEIILDRLEAIIRSMP